MIYAGSDLDMAEELGPGPQKKARLGDDREGDKKSQVQVHLCARGIYTK